MCLPLSAAEIYSAALRFGRGLRAALITTLYAAVSLACAAPPCEEAATQRWLELRSVRGHFDGGAWRAEVDRWGGEKHSAMKALAACALAGHADAGALRRIMGEPDVTLAPAHPDRSALQGGIRWAGAAGPTGGAWWVYRWRGRHDMLVLAFEAGRVVDTGWWQAGE